MKIMEIIITIRANHWSFQGENYPLVTCLSPGTLPKCPYYHHQGHSVCLLLDTCVCLSMCVCVWLTLWPPTTLSSHLPQRSQSVSVGTKEQRWGPRRKPPQPFPTVWRRSFVVAAAGHCVSVWGPAGLSAKTSSQWAYSQWTGNPLLLYLGQAELVCVCVCAQWSLCLGAFFHPAEEMGKFYIKGGRQRLLKKMFFEKLDELRVSGFSRLLPPGWLSQYRSLL